MRFNFVLECEYYQSIFPPTSKTFNDSDENAEPKEFPFMVSSDGITSPMINKLKD